MLVWPSTAEQLGRWTAAIDRLGGGERLVAAPGDIGKVAGCELAVKTADRRVSVGLTYSGEQRWYWFW